MPPTPSVRPALAQAHGEVLEVRCWDLEAMLKARREFLTLDGVEPEGVVVSLRVSVACCAALGLISPAIPLPPHSPPSPAC